MPLATFECAVFEPFDGAPMFDVCCCACDEVKVLVVLIMVWKVSKIEICEHHGDIIAYAARERAWEYFILF